MAQNLLPKSSSQPCQHQFHLQSYYHIYPVQKSFESYHTQIGVPLDRFWIQDNTPHTLIITKEYPEVSGYDSGGEEVEGDSVDVSIYTQEGVGYDGTGTRSIEDDEDRSDEEVKKEEDDDKDGVEITQPEDLLNTVTGAIPIDFKPLDRSQEHQRQIHLPDNFFSRMRMLFNPIEPCLPTCSTCRQYNSDAEQLYQAPFGHKEAESRWDLPLQFFQLFFTTPSFETIARHTNEYAKLKEAGLGRSWFDTDAGEVMIWIGILIYLGTNKIQNLDQFWRKSGEYPLHCLSTRMSQTRFSQLKRYLKVSPPGDRDSVFGKLQPLASDLEKRFQQYCTPGSNCSLDEIMIKFVGRATETYLIKTKPIPRGFKIFALCQRGYVYSFLFCVPGKGCTDGFSFINSRDKDEEEEEDLTSTAQAVVSLSKTLPRDRGLTFTIYMDNYFSNVKVFEELRSIGFGAVGTVRAKSLDYPTQHAKMKTDKLELQYNTWQTLQVRNVLSFVFQDKVLVRFLSTIHQPEAAGIIKRKKPRVSSRKWQRQINQVFGDDNIKEIKSPQVAIDYNNYMGGVDIHDQ